MSNKAELTCGYASLILVDDDIAVTGEKISTILKAANVDVELYWQGLFAKASLILVDGDITVTGEKISTILKVINVDVQPYWPGLFAKALEGINVKNLITNIGSGVGADAPAGDVLGSGGDAAAATEAKKEKKKREESDDNQSDDDMGFGLFDLV